MAVCDVCSRGVDPSDCYALTTRQVTTNEKYWQYMLDNHSFDDDLLAMMVQQQAMQRSGWMVCGSCGAMFSFDRGTAKDSARRMADPPGSGPVNVQDAAVAADRAWLNKYGRLPSWVR